MKKLLYITLVSMSVNAFAQDEVTEEVLTTTEESSGGSNLSINGKQITPEAGDIGLGFSASNVLGDVLANNGNGISANTLIIRYFLSSDMAVRGHIGINQSVRTTENWVIQDMQGDQSVQVVDKMDEEVSGYNLAVGMEMRRGSGRIQGYYGAEVTFLRTQFDRIYQYGNEMTAENVDPNSSNFGTGNIGSNPQSGNPERLLTDYDGTRIGFGLDLLLGVEYFIGPKVSIGGEFKIGPYYQSETSGVQGWESFSDDGREIREETTQDVYRKDRGMVTNANGAIMANFYF